MQPTCSQILKAVAAHGNSARAQSSRRFFKTGDGEYAADDKFIGITVPQIRLIAREFRSLPLTECKKLTRSPIHEARQAALIILTDQFTRGDKKTRGAIYKICMANTAYINNWDLVDISAPPIVGEYLLRRNWKPLVKFARSKLLWERRIAIVATYAFIRAGQFEPTIHIAEILLRDSHDLIHKAVGWMLREIGKRDVAVLKKFLAAHSQRMPRTMLRYAIEKFDAPTRAAYLSRR